MQVQRFIIVFIGVTLLGLGGWYIFSNKNEIDFNKDVRPILIDKCLDCHGGVKQNSELSFLFRETALAPSKSGKLAIVPFSPGKSELINRIEHDDDNVRMPLDAPPLTQLEVQTLKRWIAEGAKWGQHWSYRSIKNQFHQSENDLRGRGSKIDYYVTKKLEQKSLDAAPPADKSTLIRRISLDLIGLPPSIDEVQAFVNDEDEDAFEKVVDRLLSSDHFGERWASMWLDLARYADSRGYQKDILRPNIWRYRDWVIHAFNQDMPFDQFTLEQIAGDLIEDRTDAQLLASAFHRNSMTNDEGGTNDEEFRVASVIDRLNTTMEVWQATTIACVQCHSHPYDPIKHKEFYNLLAFFNNTGDTDSYRDGPHVSLLSTPQLEQKELLKERLTRWEETGDTLSREYRSMLQDFINIVPGPVPVMEELPEDSSRIQTVFIRGNWLVHGDTVSPEIPSHLPPLEEGLPQNRLGLAKWIVSEDNPLTARVFVNRIWEQLFGAGIVSTLEDFGTNAEKPSHPELLDWLAYNFMTNQKWSVKSLIKEIVLSSTYQQSSVVTDDKLMKDPTNVFLSRGPRYRLSAEQIRDQALFVSGLFNGTLYGESVMPDQPDGVWNVIRHVAQWEKEVDGNQYRRALYTFWRRVSPYPSMVAFDVPSRELCVSKRIRTNTPIHALITLNDPVYVEAAEGLADRMIDEGGFTVSDKIRYGFQIALMKEPSGERLKYLLDLYESVRLEMKSSEDALVQVATVILNLNEFIMKT